MSDKKPRSNDIIFDIILTIFTLGLWNLWVQVRQVNVVNELAGEEKFLPMLVILLLSIFTFGLFWYYHEYKMTRILHELYYGHAKPGIEIPIPLLTFLGLWIIVDSYQQSIINRIIEKQEPAN